MTYPRHQKNFPWNSSFIPSECKFFFRWCVISGKKSFFLSKSKKNIDDIFFAYLWNYSSDIFFHIPLIFFAEIPLIFFSSSSVIFFYFPVFFLLKYLRDWLFFLLIFFFFIHGTNISNICLVMFCSFHPFERWKFVLFGDVLEFPHLTLEICFFSTEEMHLPSPALFADCNCWNQQK